MKRSVAALQGLVAFALAHLVWGAFAIAIGCFGFRLSASSSNPTFAEIVLQNWRDLIVPFFPAALGAGLVLGLLVTRLRYRLAAAAYGVAAAPGAFLLTVIAGRLFLHSNGGYAAEQGLSSLAYIVVPIIGLTAAPLWATTAALLTRPRPI